MILDEVQQFVRVIFFPIDRDSWAHSLVKRSIELFREETRVLPIDNRSDLECLWVDDDVLLREIVVTENVVSARRLLKVPIVSKSLL